MDADRIRQLWPEIEPLLDQLLDLEEPERTRLLERSLDRSPETRRVVEALLRADRDITGPLETPVELPDAALPVVVTATMPAGTHIGPYVVLDEIARGGMGTVLLAERADGHFEQRVAIKLVRADAFDPGGRERFVQERRILATLQHPNIARLLDGGVLEDGAPYLVMEFVEGESITRWCDTRHLDVRARLRLFLQACEAVEYAHAQLVVHRDLKPDHILVTERGDVKLLDFGIAKLMEPSAARAMTGTHARIFTPAYATPEQYLGEPVTVATDEYQLALVLYELLTGQRAHGDTTGSPLQHQRAVLERDPERPSRRISRSAGTATATRSPAASELPATVIAATRGSTVAALTRELAGDLDAIVLKALEREPAQRYPSVEAFHRDLEAMLSDRPVAARRATTGYRVRKMVRRHRVAVTTAALVLASLATGLVGVIYQARVAARERDLARAAERRANAINDFVLRELLESPTPEHALGRPLTVSEVLASASRTVGHAFPGQPATEAGVRMTLARSYEALGRLDPAHEHAEAAAQLLATRLPADARERLDSRALLAELALDQGRAKEAEAAFARLAADQGRVLGARDPATVRSRGELGRALAAEGRWAPADSTLRNALATLALTTDPPWRLAVDLRTWLAGVWIQQARATAAESLLRECVTIEHRQLGPDHPLIVSTMRQLAQALGKDLRFPAAGRVLDDVLAMSIRLNGEDHPATGDAYSSLAVNFDSESEPDSALVAITHAVAIFRHTLGEDHPKTLRVLRDQAVLLHDMQRYAEADTVSMEVYRTCARVLGPDHWQTIEALEGLVFLRIDENRASEARDLARRVVATYEHAIAQPDVDPSTLTDFAQYLSDAEPPEVRNPRRGVEIGRRAVEATHHGDYLALRALGFAEDAAGDPRAAIASLEEALALPDGVRSWTTEDKLVDLLEKHGAPGELEHYLGARLTLERRVRGADDRYIGKTLRHLARLYRRTGRDGLAEATTRAALAQLRKTLPDTHWEIGRVKADLGELLVARHAYGEAESLLVQGFTTLEADPGVPSTSLVEVRDAIARLYRESGRPRVAQNWRTRVIASRAGHHG